MYNHQEPHTRKSPATHTGYLTRMALRYRSRSPFAVYAAIIRDLIGQVRRPKQRSRITNSVFSFVVVLTLLFTPFSTTTFATSAASVAPLGNSAQKDSLPAALASTSLSTALSPDGLKPGALQGIATNNLVGSTSPQKTQQQNLGGLPLSFETNSGQADKIDPTAQFLAHSSAGTYFFSPDHLLISISIPNLSTTEGSNQSGVPQDGLRGQNDVKYHGKGDVLGQQHLSQQVAKPALVRMDFVGANAQSSVQGGSLLPGKVNYYIGNDPSKWHTNLSTYSDITYEALYPGIDLGYSSASDASGAGGSTLKGTYSVAPGADSSLIRWRYQHADSISVDPEGDLQVSFSVPVELKPSDGSNASPSTTIMQPITVTEQTPVAWQQIDGQKIPVQVSYTLDQAAGSASIGFELGSYDRNQPLIIDPSLSYSTYLGGDGYDEIYGIAVDSQGSVYLGGDSSSSPLDTLDISVKKINAAGSALLYTTYLGGSDYEWTSGFALVVDALGRAYVTGDTDSVDFPATAGAFQTTNAGGGDAVVAQLDSDGSLLDATYLGGTGYDRSLGIAVDGSGNVYVAGYTGSTDYPTQNPIQGNQLLSDATVTKISNDLSALVYSTYLGGNSDEWASAIAVDDAGNAYVTGSTFSTSGFPLVSALYPILGGSDDAFVTKINSTGSAWSYSTYLGGGADDRGAGIAVDATGQVYVTGETASKGSSPFPTANAFQPTCHCGTYDGDAFVTKINATDTALVYSTYFGGYATRWEQANAIAIDSSGDAFVTGFTEAPDFPLMKPIQDHLYSSAGTDVFVTKFSPAGSALSYSTYLGGNFNDGGYAIAVDASGTTYVAGFTQSDGSYGPFPTTPDALQSAYGGDPNDSLYVKIGDDPRPSEIRCGGSPSETPSFEDVGDLINTATGYYCYSSNLLTIPSRGNPLQFSVTYNSDLTSTNSTLSGGWTHNYNMWIDQDPSGNFQVHEENGNVVAFGPAPSYSHSPKIMATLTYSSAISSYIFTRIHGQNSYYFTSQAGTYKLSKIVDRNGYTINLSYTSGQLGGVEDTFGHALGLNYLSGRLSQVKDKAGNRTVQLAYTSTNPLGSGAPLSSITDVGGHASAFRYITSTNQLQTVTDANGGVTTNNYYADGRISQQTYPENRYLQFSYSAPITSTSITTRITDTLGLVTVYSYTNNMVRQVTDHVGLPAEATWNYAYQPGTNWVSSATDPLTNVWSSTWDENGNLLSQTDPLSHATQYSYYPNNFLNVVTDTASIPTTYSRDTNGNILSVSTPLTQTGETATTMYTYDPAHAGDVIAVTDPLTHTWSYTYDTYGYPRSATDPLTPSHTSYTYYDNVGRMYGSLDANTNPTNYSHNAYGDLVSVTNALSYTTVYTYDAVGNLLNTRDPKGNVVTNTYSLNNQLTRVTQPDGTYSEYFYDGVGRIDYQTNPLRVTSADYTYDDLNRAYNVYDALDRSHEYKYDLAGRLERIQDPEGRYTYLNYYNNNQLQTIDYTDGVTPDVTYTYDDRGLRASMADGYGTVTYGYDSLNRLRSTSRNSADILSGQVDYDYDLTNHVTSVEYPANSWDGIRRTLTYTYNDAGQMDTLTDFFDTPTSFTYDNNGNLKQINTTLSSGPLTRDFEYDKANQVITTTSMLDALSTYSLVMTYTRDAVGLLKNAYELDNGASVAATHVYTYDTLNRLTASSYQAVDPSQSITSTWNMDAASQVTRTEVITASSAPFTTTYEYDNANQLAAMTTNQTSPSATQVYTFQNSLEGNRVLQLQNPGSAQPITTTYGYDMDNRLTGYEYDSLYDPFRVNSGYYRYDGDGLRLGRDIAGTNFGGTSTLTSTWDSSVLAGALPLLLHDSKVSTGSPTMNDVSYIYGPGGIPLAQFSEYIPLSKDQGSKGNRVPDSPSGAFFDLSYFLTDQAGSVRALVDGNGQVSGEFQYDEYGNRGCFCNGDFPFGFTGQYTDDESGMLYLRARNYDPLTQQFISRDPSGASAGQPYVYANRNPVNYIDPTGTTALFNDEGGGEIPPSGRVPQSPVGAGSTVEGGGGGAGAANAALGAESEWTFIGYHGTTSRSAENIQKYGVLDEFYGENMGEGHLGRGFYTTESKSAAKQYAIDAAANYDGPGNVRPAVLRVFARNLSSMEGLRVPNATGARDVLDRWITDYDYLTKQMIGFSGESEIKFNPRAYSNLRVGR